MKIFPFCNTRLFHFSFEIIYLSENKEHRYLNALKIQKKALSWIGCYPVAREMVQTRIPPPLISSESDA